MVGPVPSPAVSRWVLAVVALLAVVVVAAGVCPAPVLFAMKKPMKNPSTRPAMVKRMFSFIVDKSL